MTFFDYLDLISNIPLYLDLDLGWFLQSLVASISFCIKCDLLGFITLVLESPQFGLEKKSQLITQFLKLSIDFRRVNILQTLIEFANTKKLAVYEECENPLIFVYKRSYFLVI